MLSHLYPRADGVWLCVVDSEADVQNFLKQSLVSMYMFELQRVVTVMVILGKNSPDGLGAYDAGQYILRGIESELIGRSRNRK
jgi:hypothetical protein